jgi:hypothetical protein
MVVNSQTYYNQSSPVDGTVVTGGPCAARMVDVKMTETDLPWYFKLANVSFIDAHARVSIFQATESAGSLPIGVPDVNPKSAKVTFVDETTNPRPCSARAPSPSRATWVGSMPGTTAAHRCPSP